MLPSNSNEGVTDLTEQVIGVTRRLLSDADIRSGMRVLDLGCGRADVSLMLSEMVGERGHVIGIDRDPAAIEQARQRSNALRRSNLSFEVADLESCDLGTCQFDAICTRRTLMYLPDPAATLRRFAERLKPGGVIAIQEHDALMVPASSAVLPLHRKVNQWIWRTVEKEGGNPRMGFSLAAVLADAGLWLESLRVEAIAQTPSLHYPLGPIATAMVPRLVRAGVATADEIDADTLDARLLAERQAANATFIGDVIFCAVGRKPN